MVLKKQPIPNAVLVTILLMAMVTVVSAEIPTVIIPLPSSATTSIILINGSATGNCTGGQFVQNITSTQIKCALPPSGGGGNPFNQVLNTTSNVQFALIKDYGHETIGNISAYPETIYIVVNSLAVPSPDPSGTCSNLGFGSYYNGRPSYYCSSTYYIFWDGGQNWWMDYSLGSTGTGNSFISQALIGRFFGLWATGQAYTTEVEPTTSINAPTGQFMGAIQDGYFESGLGDPNYIHNKAYMFTEDTYTCDYSCFLYQQASFLDSKFLLDQRYRIMSLDCIAYTIRSIGGFLTAGDVGAGTCTVDYDAVTGEMLIKNRGTAEPMDSPYGQWLEGDNITVFITYTQ